MAKVRPIPSGTIAALSVAIVTTAMLVMMVSSGLTPPVAMFVLIACFGALVALSPQVAIAAAFVFLAVMGGFRRLLLQDSGPSLDPVLLVGPVVAAALFMRAWACGQLNTASRTSRMILVLMGIMILEIFNPIQGGITVGLAGALFYIVPILWYWIGQAWGTESLLSTLLFRIIVPVGFAASLMGIRQAMYGFYPFEIEALHRLGINNTTISGSQWRPWAFFPSSSEYSAYLSIGIVTPVVSLFARRYRFALLLVPTLAVALFLSGVRGPVANTLATAIVAWAMLSRSVAVVVMRLALAALIVLGGFLWTLDQAQEMDLSPQLSSLIQHQTSGFVDIGDAHKSSAQGHLQAIPVGILRSLSTPLGRGLGSTTIAAGKFGGAADGTEVDLSDAFLSIGLVGGLVYMAIVYSVLSSLIRKWRITHSAAALSVLAVLSVMFGRWLYGGQYATAAFCWFCIGSANRRDDAEVAFRGSGALRTT
jgi:hypothetical protein